jgi:O-antigen/teichoic acid export membrane protein
VSGKVTTPFWLQYLPPILRTKVERSPNLIKILSNIGWLFSESALRLGIGLIVGVWLARYLGPEQFGLLNYALAFVSLFVAIATLGLKDIVVRDIVNDPSRTNEILGTSFLLRLIGGLISIALIFVSFNYIENDDPLAKPVIVILGFTLVFQASGVVKCWFESEVMSKYIVWMQNGVFLTGAAIKVYLILAQASLLAFVWVIFFEALAIAVGMFAVYLWKAGQLSAWHPRLACAKGLLRDSWPLILSAIAVTIYMRIDQIMLGQMMGNEAVGIYTAAVRISEVWYFIPVAIVASVFPSILNARKQSDLLYNQRLQKLYDLMVLLSLAVALPMTFLSDWVVVLLFGPAYTDAGLVLAIHIWAALFVFLGVASEKWLVAENRQALSFQRTLLGALVNIGLNIFLIPKFGIIGAAYATVISQAFAALFFDVAQKETRPMFAMKLRSLNILRFARFVQVYKLLPAPLTISSGTDCSVSSFSV